MSTRSQILIEGSKASIYRHCDGYPGTPDGTEYGVLADLMPILRAFKADRGWDVEYLVARVAQRLMNKHVPDGSITYGICTKMPSDLAFVYVIKKNWSIEVRETNTLFWDAPSAANTALVGTFQV